MQLVTNAQIVAGLTSHETQTVLVGSNGHYLIHVLTITKFYEELISASHFKLVTPQGEAKFGTISEAQKAWGDAH